MYDNIDSGVKIVPLANPPEEEDVALVAPAIEFAEPDTDVEEPYPPAG